MEETPMTANGEHSVGTNKCYRRGPGARVNRFPIQLHHTPFSVKRAYCIRSANPEKLVVHPEHSPAQMTTTTPTRGLLTIAQEIADTESVGAELWAEKCAHLSANLAHMVA